VRNSAFNLAGQAIPAAIWAAALPLALRALGIERIGLLGLIWVLLGYVTIFDWGLSRALTKLLSEARGHGSAASFARHAWTGIACQGVVGALGLLAVVGLTAVFPLGWVGAAESLAGEARGALRVAALALPMMLVANGFQSVLEAELRFAQVGAARVVSGLLSAGALFIGAVLGLDLVGFAAVLVLAKLLAAAVFGVVAVRSARLPPPEAPRWATVQELFHFGKWVMVSNWLGPLLLVGDRVIVATALPASDLGYYTVPQEVVVRLLVISGGVAVAAFPALTALISRGDMRGALRVWRQGLVLLALATLGMIGLALCGREVLAAWMGSGVASVSGALLQVLALGGAMQGLAQLPAVLLQAAGRPDWVTKVQAAVVGPYLVGVFGLVRTNGVEGVAWAWTGRACVQMLGYFILAFIVLGKATPPARPPAFSSVGPE
jgi:O-antigen/teichoic acid export membrane protein